MSANQGLKINDNDLVFSVLNGVKKHSVVFRKT
jgi:hypothetical protein